jgi:hypothetical protein
VDELPEKQMKKFLTSVRQFVGVRWANDITQSINIKTKTYKLSMDNFVVCNQTGGGYLLSEGGVAGIWAYVMSDSSIEGKQIKCQGRGDEKCQAIYAPKEVLLKKGLKTFVEQDLENDLSDGLEYRELNWIKPAKYAPNSLKKLIDAGFFDYFKRELTFKGERYFPCEASIIYMIENELKKLDGGPELLFSTSSSSVKGMNNKGDAGKFITDYISALGWGDILVLQKGNVYVVTVESFPWTKFSKESAFIIFRGMLSGLISDSHKSTYTIPEPTKDVSDGSLNLVFKATPQ